MADKSKDIVIVGAGIIGLDVALVLCEKGLGKYITIVAEYFPGDTSPSYCSPWAGCNFSAISGTDANALKWDREGYSYLTDLENKHGKEAYVQKIESVEYWDERVPKDKIKFMSEYLQDFNILPSSKLPQATTLGISFTTFTINAPKHIAYLANRLRTQYGVTFIRKVLPDITSAYTLSPSATTKIVFNCTGANARTFKGVEDKKCYPTRGQVVLVKAPASVSKRNMMRHGAAYETYIIPRPGTDGHVVLGGFMQKGSSDPATYRSETDSILTRTMELNPDLKVGGEGPEILATVTGARPSREGGARIERDVISVNGEDKVLVHNYGAGGTGFQAGRGMAVDAVGLVEDVLGQIIADGHGEAVKSKL